MFFHFLFFRNFIIFWKSSKKNKNGTQLGFNSDLDSCVPPPGLSPYDIDEYLCCFFRKSPSRKRFMISWRTKNKVLFGRTNPGRLKSGTHLTKLVLNWTPVVPSVSVTHPRPRSQRKPVAALFPVYLASAFHSVSKFLVLMKSPQIFFEKSLYF